MSINDTEASIHADQEQLYMDEVLKSQELKLNNTQEDYMKNPAKHRQKNRSRTNINVLNNTDAFVDRLNDSIQDKVIDTDIA